jgi:hypothetical protein
VVSDQNHAYRVRAYHGADTSEDTNVDCATAPLQSPATFALVVSKVGTGTGSGAGPGIDSVTDGTKSVANDTRRRLYVHRPDRRCGRIEHCRSGDWERMQPAPSNHSSGSQDGHFKPHPMEDHR